MNSSQNGDWSRGYDARARVLMHWIFFLTSLSFFIFCFMTLIPHSGFAQKQSVSDLECVLQGFEEQTIPVLIPDQVHQGDDVLSNSSTRFPSINFSGSFSTHVFYSPYQHTTAAGYFVHGLTSLKSRLAFALDGKISEDWYMKISGWGFFDFAYSLQGKEHYSAEVLENYEQELELGETYIRGRLSSYLDITLGRQVVVWGKADLFRVTDMFNPIDNSERGLDDVEVKRLPLLMTRLDTYLGSWRLSSSISHELRYNKDPVFGHDFYPYDFPAPPREDRSNNLKNSSFGLSVERSYRGFDIAFYSGSFLKEQDRVGLTSETPQRYLNRLDMLGIAVEKAQKYWLYKVEVSVKDGFEYYSLPDQKKKRLDLLVGADYTGLANTRLSLEIVNRHIFELDSEMAEWDDTPAIDSLIWAFRAARSFQREKLSLVFLVYAGGFTFSQGSAQNISAEYKVSDLLTVKAGYIFIQSGDNYLMRDMGDNDKLFLKLNYKF